MLYWKRCKRRNKYLRKEIEANTNGAEKITDRSYYKKDPLITKKSDTSFAHFACDVSNIFLHILYVIYPFCVPCFYFDLAGDVRLKWFMEYLHIKMVFFYWHIFLMCYNLKKQGFRGNSMETDMTVVLLAVYRSLEL